MTRHAPASVAGGARVRTLARRLLHAPRHFLAGRDWAVAAALVLLAAAFAVPSVDLPRDTFTYMVTFDITQSMDAEDMSLNGAPASRLAFAKASMRDALGQLPCGSKVGWSVFTGQAALPLVTPVEVCRHYDALLASLAAIDGRMRWTNWSRIAEGGIYSAVRVAHTIGQGGGQGSDPGIAQTGGQARGQSEGQTVRQDPAARGVAVVFFTDGQEAPPILPSNGPAIEIGMPGVKGWLIGVGGEQPVPVPKTDASGRKTGYWSAADVVQVPPADRPPGAGESHEELSGLRGPYLASVASRIGFGYRRLLGPASLATALRDPSLAHREPVPTDVRWALALAALLLLTWRYAGSPQRARRWTLRSPFAAVRAKGRVHRAGPSGVQAPARAPAANFDQDGGRSAWVE
ncbi:MxaL protein [Paraburkholderia kururiensis]|uniref:MxaL protein n=1 Tax=Paraburkholderia kururiensis TaxID=984307 RepID=A0ABZ0WJR2_9BURK|nr:MxaL protein [Paraburkholderia kururiensis]WQD77593.1 MxaL protein [Paraburkholderia kururiensis]